MSDKIWTPEQAARFILNYLTPKDALAFAIRMATGATERGPDFWDRTLEIVRGENG